MSEDGENHNSKPLPSPRVFVAASKPVSKVTTTKLPSRPPPRMNPQLQSEIQTANESTKPMIRSQSAIPPRPPRKPAGSAPTVPLTIPLIQNKQPQEIKAQQTSPNPKSPKREIPKPLSVLKPVSPRKAALERNSIATEQPKQLGPTKRSSSAFPRVRSLPPTDSVGITPNQKQPSPITNKRVQEQTATPPTTEKQSSPVNKDKEEKKASKEKRKGILRRRTKSKGYSSLRHKTKSPVAAASFSVLPDNFSPPVQHTTRPTSSTIVESPPRRPSVILFRVRLQDDNYKTMPINENTSADQLCETLSNKLRKERPEQVWDGCELFETIDGKEVRVDGSTILSKQKDPQYLFKRAGEKVANPEEELQKIIKQREQIQFKRNTQMCNLFFSSVMDNFPNEDIDYLNTLFDIYSGFSDPTSQTDDVTTKLQKIPLLLKNLEEETAISTKKFQNAKKVKKRNNRLFLDTSRVIVLKQIAEAGGSFAAIYSVSVDGAECAMKELILDGVADASAFLTEIAVLEALPHHENLVQLVKIIII